MKIGYVRPEMKSCEINSDISMLSASARSAASNEFNDTIKDWRTFWEDVW